MQSDSNELEKTISSYVGKLFRDNFGKGPESVFVSIGDTYMIIYLKNLLSPLEKVLFEQDHVEMLDHLRIKVIETLKPEIVFFIQFITGVKVKEFYYDWNYHNSSGVIICNGYGPFIQQSLIFEKYPEKEIIHEIVYKVSGETEKHPEMTTSFIVNEKNIISIRIGILLRVEKELIRMGKDDLLKTVKRKLEKNLFHNASYFNKSLSQRIVDIFVDWNFELDKSIVLFVLK